MQGFNLDGLQYVIMAGGGGIVGCVFVVLMLVLSIWFPALMAWAWVPPVAGTVAGLIAGVWVR